MSWVEWALSIANRIDPTIDSPKLSIDDKEEVLKKLEPLRYI